MGGNSAFTPSVPDVRKEEEYGEVHWLVTVVWSLDFVLDFGCIQANMVLMGDGLWECTAGCLSGLLGVLHVENCKLCVLDDISDIIYFFCFFSWCCYWLIDLFVYTFASFFYLLIVVCMYVCMFVYVYLLFSAKDRLLHVVVLCSVNDAMLWVWCVSTLCVPSVFCEWWLTVGVVCFNTVCAKCVV